jgi:hypothetical protein
MYLDVKGFFLGGLLIIQLLRSNRPSWKAKVVTVLKGLPLDLIFKRMNPVHTFTVY